MNIIKTATKCFHVKDGNETEKHTCNKKKQQKQTEIKILKPKKNKGDLKKRIIKAASGTNL